MKKYISLAAVFVLFAISACTPSTPVANNTSDPKAASPSSTASEKPSEKPKASTTPDPKATEKLTNNAESWQDYKSSAGKFSVQLPSKPQEQSQDKTTNAGTIKVNSVFAEANDSGYFVGYADIPSKVSDPADVQKGLGNSVKDLSTSIQGEIKSEKESLVGDIPCRDFESVGKVKTTDVLMKGRFCLADNRLYQIFALGAKDKLTVADVDRFITSFKIEK